MTKNLRITIGCLAVLTLVLVFGVAFWWVSRQGAQEVPGYEGRPSPPTYP